MGRIQIYAEVTITIDSTTSTKRDHLLGLMTTNLIVKAIFTIEDVPVIRVVEEKRKIDKSMMVVTNILDAWMVSINLSHTMAVTNIRVAWMAVIVSNLMNIVGDIELRLMREKDVRVREFYRVLS